MSATQNYRNLKIAVLGCGNWGKNLIRVLHNLGALAGVCDTCSIKSQQFSQQYQVPALTFEQILNAKDIHGVFIATPSKSHYEIALSCLKANKHVYIEKPFAQNGAQAQALAQLANQRQRVLMIGHLLQYHSAFQQLKQLKKEGVLGSLQFIYCNRFNFGKYLNENSVLMDYAPHDISMVLSLVEGLPSTVMAMNANHLQHTVSDTTSLQLVFPGNIKAHIFSSWLYPFKEQKMIVIGSKAMAVFEDSQPWESKLRLGHYPMAWEDGLPNPFHCALENVTVMPSEPLQNECSHFLDCILNGEEPRTGCKEGLRVMSVLDAAQTSIQIGTPVQVQLDKEIADLSKTPDTLLEY